MELGGEIPINIEKKKKILVLVFEYPANFVRNSSLCLPGILLETFNTFSIYCFIAFSFEVLPNFAHASLSKKKKIREIV